MQSVSKEHKGAEREHERARRGPWASREGAAREQEGAARGHGETRVDTEGAPKENRESMREHHGSLQGRSMWEPETRSQPFGLNCPVKLAGDTEVEYSLGGRCVSPPTISKIWTH